jgi:hypothetical protein
MSNPRSAWQILEMIDDLPGTANPAQVLSTARALLEHLDLRPARMLRSPFSVRMADIEAFLARAIEAASSLGDEQAEASLLGCLSVARGLSALQLVRLGIIYASRGTTGPDATGIYIECLGRSIGIDEVTKKKMRKLISLHLTNEPTARDAAVLHAQAWGVVLQESS